MYVSGVCRSGAIGSMALAGSGGAMGVCTELY